MKSEKLKIQNYGNIGVESDDKKHLFNNLINQVIRNFKKQSLFRYLFKNNKEK